jgi:sulfur-oxidizing protein SoxA
MSPGSVGSPRHERASGRGPATAEVLAAALFFAALAGVATANEIPPDQRRSDYELMSRETRAMQDDDTANPGMFWVLDGEALWGKKAGSADRSCADCHGDARESMKGVAARYPAFNGARGRPINLEQRVNICRTENQKAPPLAPESKDLLALTAYLGRQSRGMPITISVDRMIEFLETGRSLFHRRQGQLNLSCSQCHNDNWGKLLAGNVVPQGHPTGYPLYRLEWQSLGSLQRRFRNCMIGLRAEPYDHGSPEHVALELYLMWRARGLAVETPAVRP